jgi:hypothetical protein
VKAPVVSVGIKFEEKEIWGSGHSIGESLKCLAGKMPKGVQLLTNSLTL